LVNIVHVIPLDERRIKRLSEIESERERKRGRERERECERKWVREKEREGEREWVRERESVWDRESGWRLIWELVNTVRVIQMQYKYFSSV
jgi:hypothetical protein